MPAGILYCPNLRDPAGSILQRKIRYEVRRMFREQIRKHYDHLSRSYRRVADFILSDYRTAAFMTAAALADAVDVDTTTVVRFAQRLGYPGYPELIEDI